jgi:hypothetical protein
VFTVLEQVVAAPLTAQLSGVATPFLRTVTVTTPVPGEDSRLTTSFAAVPDGTGTLELSSSATVEFPQGSRNLLLAVMFA